MLYFFKSMDSGYYGKMGDDVMYYGELYDYEIENDLEFRDRVLEY